MKVRIKSAISTNRDFPLNPGVEVSSKEFPERVLTRWVNLGWADLLEGQLLSEAELKKADEAAARAAEKKGASQ